MKRPSSEDVAYGAAQWAIAMGGALLVLVLAATIIGFLMLAFSGVCHH